MVGLELVSSAVTCDSFLSLHIMIYSKAHVYIPAMTHPITTSNTDMTTVGEGLFFSMTHANSKLANGSILLKMLYLRNMN